MEAKTIQLKSCHGEIITCSVKKVEKHESGKIKYWMDNKKCNDFHNSEFDPGCDDCRVRLVITFASGKCDVFVSYKSQRGHYMQGAQCFDADVVQIDQVNP
jgi:hypothetical protein